MWTARGKAVLNLVEDLTKYLLALLAPSHLSNSQSYKFMNFTAHLVSKLAKISEFFEIHPMCVAGGKIILTLAVRTFLYLHLKFYKSFFLIDKTTVMRSSLPNLFPNSHHSPPLEEILAKECDICAMWVLHQQIKGMSGFISKI